MNSKKKVNHLLKGQSKTSILFMRIDPFYELGVICISQLIILFSLWLSIGLPPDW